MRALTTLLSVAATVVRVPACGSSGDDSVFKGGTSGGASGTSGGASGGFGTSGGASGTSGGASGGTSGGAGTVGNVDPSSACATSSAGADLDPVSLVFMIDRSGSMGGGAASVRWNPVVAGLEAFYADAGSKNIESSLAFFPINDKDGKSVCTSASYQTQAVAMSPLPDDTSFRNAFKATGPGGGTPTSPALTGAIEYAKTIKAAGKKVAIVLATDGQPNDCSSTVSGVANVAASGVTAGIKTYVVGVGPDTGNLDQIATGGGTSKAIMIPTSDPAQVSTDLRKAVGVIAASLLGCQYNLPAPPSGQSLDVNSVNVNYTPGAGTLSTLKYSADCSNAGGWHYDNPAAPTKIVMCPSICDTLTKDTSGGKVSIVFGCKTAGAEGGVPGGPPPK